MDCCHCVCTIEILKDFSYSLCELSEALCTPPLACDRIPSHWIMDLPLQMFCGYQHTKLAYNVIMVYQGSKQCPTIVILVNVVCLHYIQWHGSIIILSIVTHISTD